MFIFITTNRANDLRGPRPKQGGEKQQAEERVCRPQESAAGSEQRQKRLRKEPG